MHGRHVEAVPFALARKIECYQVRYDRRYVPSGGLHGVDIGLVEPCTLCDNESDHAGRHAAVEYGPGRLGVAISTAAVILPAPVEPPITVISRSQPASRG